MPNWCVSWIDIEAPKASIDLLWPEFEQALSGNPYGTDYGTGWLGNLLGRIGMLDERGGGCDMRYRGWVSDLERTGPTRIQLQTESAWGPHITCIKAFVDHYVDDAQVFYECEEPGNAVYWTNNPDTAGMVHIDCYDAEGLPEELAPFEEHEDRERGWVIEALGRALDDESDDLDHLIASFNERAESMGSEARLYANPYEFVEIGEET